jgi:hypothetical protein
MHLVVGVPYGGSADGKAVLALDLLVGVGIE